MHLVYNLCTCMLFCMISGMMMLPTFTAGQVKVSGSVTTGQSIVAPNTPEVACGLPVILQSPHSVPELNFIMTSPASQLQQSPLLPANQRAVSGTVHHKGSGGSAGDGPGPKPSISQSPGKELSFAHVKSQLQQESTFSLVARTKRPRIESSGSSVQGFGTFEMSASPLDDVGVEVSSTKKIKLEEDDASSDDSGTSVYRKFYCMEHEKELEKKTNTYEALVTELFFLENGGHFMDYFAWMKRATANGTLIRYLRARKAEDLGEYNGHEKSINNEVIHIGLMHGQRFCKVLHYLLTPLVKTEHILLDFM